MNKKKIITGKGSEYSKIAKEMDTYYKGWLCASGISEEDFLKLVNCEDFHLSFSADPDMVMIILCNSAGEIAAPLVWQKENGIDLASYKLDASLLLMLVSGKCSNRGSQDKIKDFVKDTLRV